MLREDQEVVAAKRALRAEAATLRREAAAVLPPDKAGERVAAALLERVVLPAGVAVSAYWPLPEELDPRPLALRLHEAGHAIGLPVVARRGEPLLFRRWLPGMRLVEGAYRVLTPPPDAPEVVPAVLLMPLLAFDEAGFRLGYGGGYYDRTLSRLRAAGRVIGIGLGYAAQEVPSVPREPTDQPLDWIVTESGARRFGGGSASGNRY